MTPQEYSMELAKRLQATAMLAEGLLWCSFVMRSWNNLDDVLAYATESAEKLAEPTVPFLNHKARVQLEALKELRAVVGPGAPKWAEVQKIARRLLESLQSNCRGKPGEDASLTDSFKNRRALPPNPWADANRTAKAPPRKRRKKG